jgi:predicted aspartyl protease
MNLANPKKRMRVKFRVDSGAIYSVVPKTVLKSLGIKPCGSKSFALADGATVTRKIGNALFA